MTQEKIDGILRQIPEYQRGKGEQRAVRRACGEAVEAADTLVKIGVRKWSKPLDSRTV